MGNGGKPYHLNPKSFHPYTNLLRKKKAYWKEYFLIKEIQLRETIDSHRSEDDLLH